MTPTPHALLSKIVTAELEKLSKISETDMLLSGGQLESLEVLARILKAAPPQDPNADAGANAMSLETALALMAGGVTEPKKPDALAAAVATAPEPDGGGNIVLP